MPHGFVRSLQLHLSTNPGSVVSAKAGEYAHPPDHSGMIGHLAALDPTIFLFLHIWSVDICMTLRNAISPLAGIPPSPGECPALLLGNQMADAIKCEPKLRLQMLLEPAMSTRSSIARSPDETWFDFSLNLTGCVYSDALRGNGEFRGENAALCTPPAPPSSHAQGSEAWPTLYCSRPTCFAKPQPPHLAARYPWEADCFWIPSVMRSIRQEKLPSGRTLVLVRNL